MNDTDLPNDRFSWLGKGVPPDDVIIPVDNATPVLEEIKPPNQVTGADGLGIIRWLMGTEEERKDAISGCPMFDNFIVFDIPKED